MSIADRSLAVGTKLVARYKGKEFECEVIIGENGKTAYWVDGKTYKSPSAAGMAVMSGVACNGWRFWSVKGQEPKPKARKKAKAAAEPVEHVDCTCPSQEPGENGICKFEESGDCRPV